MVSINETELSAEAISTDSVELFTSPILTPISPLTVMRSLTARVAIIFWSSGALDDEIAEEIDWRAEPTLPDG